MTLNIARGKTRVCYSLRWCKKLPVSFDVFNIPFINQLGCDALVHSFEGAEFH